MYMLLYNITKHVINTELMHWTAAALELYCFYDYAIIFKTKQKHQKELP